MLFFDFTISELTVFCLCKVQYFFAIQYFNIFQFSQSILASSYESQCLIVSFHSISKLNFSEIFKTYELIDQVKVKQLKNIILHNFGLSVSIFNHILAIVTFLIRFFILFRFLFLEKTQICQVPTFFEICQNARPHQARKVRHAG